MSIKNDNHQKNSIFNRQNNQVIKKDQKLISNGGVGERED